MRDFRLLLLLLGAIALVSAAPLRSQPPVAVSDTVREVRLADGSVLYGRVVAADAQRVTLVTLSGVRVEVERAQLVSVRAADGSYRASGAFWPRDPAESRLFFAATGRTLRAGQGIFTVSELIVPSLSYGVTDRLSIGGGLPVIPEEIGELAFLTARLQLYGGEHAQLAAGAFSIFGVEEVDAQGLLYLTGTAGDAARAVTLAAAVPFYRDSDGSDEVPGGVLLMAGAEARISRRIKLLTENYWVPGEEGIVASAGFRLIEQRLAADFGLGFFTGEDSECCLPLVSFSYTFGGPR